MEGAAQGWAKPPKGLLSLAYPVSCDSPIRMHYSHQALQTQLPCSFGNPHELLHSGMVGVGRERGTLCAGNYVQACCHGAGSLCLFFLGLDSDHFWPPGGCCYSWSMGEELFSPQSCHDSFCWGKRREKEGKYDESMSRCVYISLLALMPMDTNGGGCDGREQSLHFLT